MANKKVNRVPVKKKVVTKKVIKPKTVKTVKKKELKTPKVETTPKPVLKVSSSIMDNRDDVISDTNNWL